MPTECRNCGLALDTNDAFCGNCGRPADLGSAAPGGTVAAAASPWGSDRGGGGVPPPASEMPPGQQRQAATAAAAEPAGDLERRLAAEHEQLDHGLSGDWSFDPLRNKRFLAQIARRFGLYTVAAFTVEFIFFLFAAVTSLSSGNTPSLGGVSKVSALLWIALVLLFWLLPVPGLLRQWSSLLSHQAPAAQRAFDCIHQAIDRHATPRDALRERGYPLPGEGHRRFLELHRGVFTGYISCFPHGNDLYVGYSFWIRMSPLRLLFMGIGRSIQNWSGRGNDMYQTLRYESTRATVDAIHTCTVEGIAAAIDESGPAGPQGARPPVSPVPVPVPSPAGDQARQRARRPASQGGWPGSG